MMDLDDTFCTGLRSTLSGRCEKCFKIFDKEGTNRPFILLCGHSICHNDLMTIKSELHLINCPVCDDKTSFSQYPDDFPPANLALMENIRRSEATMCLQLNDDKCQDCGKKVADTHCSDCNSHRCNDCDVQHHSKYQQLNHSRMTSFEYLDTSKIISLAKDSLQNKLDDSVSRINRVEQLTLQILQNPHETTAGSQVAVDLIREAFSTIKDSVSAREVFLIAAANSCIEKAIRCADGARLSISTGVVEARVAQDIARQLLLETDLSVYLNSVDAAMHGLDVATERAVFTCSQESAQFREPLSTQVQFKSPDSTDAIDHHRAFGPSVERLLQCIESLKIEPAALSYGTGEDGDLYVDSLMVLDSHRLYNFRNVVVAGILTVGTGGKLLLQASGRIDITPGGWIDLDGSGHGCGVGRGSGECGQLQCARPTYDYCTSSPTCCPGGGGGGYGTPGSASLPFCNTYDVEVLGCAGGKVYGSPELPDMQLHKGSGGGAAGIATGGAGGGALLIRSPVFRNAGRVSCNGSGGKAGGVLSGAGGGSGGSVKIQAGVIEDIGTISAVGGAGGAGGQSWQKSQGYQLPGRSSGVYGGNGGEGRIRIEFSSCSSLQFAGMCPAPTIMTL